MSLMIVCLITDQLLEILKLAFTLFTCDKTSQMRYKGYPREQLTVVTRSDPVLLLSDLAIDLLRLYGCLCALSRLPCPLATSLR